MIVIPGNLIKSQMRHMEPSIYAIGGSNTHLVKIINISTFQKIFLGRHAAFWIGPRSIIKRKETDALFDTPQSSILK